MRNSIFKQVSKTAFYFILLLILGTGTLQAQTADYRCFCDSSYSNGVLGFEITVSGSSAGEVWTVDNVINLYSNINPDIVISNGSQIPVDPMNSSSYVLSGFAYDGVRPFVTIRNGSDILNINMTTCSIPTGEITGVTDLCVGGEAVFDFDVTTFNVNSDSTMWSTPGATTSIVSGVDDLRLTVSYDVPGSYAISVKTASSSDCPISDNIFVTVGDVSDDIVISGPDYLCSAVASNIEYLVTNPDDFQLQWNSTPAATITPMTGSGTMVDATFPAVGLYVLDVTNDDANGCTISGVDFAVNVVDVIDTIPILGDTYVCQEGIETYTISNPGDYNSLQWSITPTTGVTMLPADGQADVITITYTDPDDYVINVVGNTSDGCRFDSNLNVVVPGSDIGTLACNNSVNVSLNNSCILELLPEMILEGEGENNDAYSLIITNALTGEELTDNQLGQDDLDQVYNVTVIEECGGNSCWGTLTVEDKSIPSIVPFCEDLPIVVTCFEFDSLPSSPTGYPDFGLDSESTYDATLDHWLVSGFDACNDAIVLSFDDESLTTDECADPQVIIRTWTAVDNSNGAETSCMVTINVSLLDGSMIQWPYDYDTGLDVDGFGNPNTDNFHPSLDACNVNNRTILLNPGDKWIPDANGNPSPESTGSPKGDAFACPSLQVIGYKDQVLPVCGLSRKILRVWTVWDVCNLTDIMHTQIITLMDVDAPVCTAPSETVIYTDIHECGADIVVTPPTVTDECNDYTYIVKYKLDRNSAFGTENVEFDVALNSYVIEGVDFVSDSIWVQYIVRDACGNETDDCYTEFELIDNEQPIPACDFNNVVSLNSDGWAIAGPGTFDDNSWDNCGIYQTVVQKMDNECECHGASFDFLNSLGEYNGHYYYLSKEKTSGYKAARLSAAIDGYVANVDDEEENNWLREQVNKISSSEYFIGLEGTSTSSLAWSTGDTSSYRNWYGAEPSLNASAFAKGDIYVSVNDDGTWNAERNNQVSAYYIVELESNCEWSQKVTFCCEDVGQETMVALRVIDHHGNHNFCMVNVNVMEFEAPYITCPDDVTITCDENFDPTDLTSFGSATATDNCGVKEIKDSNSGFTAESCGRGIVVRTLTAIDYADNENSCTQRIYLQGDKVFDYRDIVWPQTDTIINEVCSLEGISTDRTGVPTWDESAFPCSNITYTHTDLMFYIVEGACQKLIRTWTVVDWCQDNKIWEEVQVIKLVNTVAPQIDPASCESITVTNGTPVSECTVRVEDIIANNITVAGACNDSPNWSFEIDFHNDGTIDRTGAGNNASGNFEYGTHKLTWTIFDDCGNESSCEKFITVLDNLPPTPYCHGTIVIPISDTLGVEIWASDLNLGSFDNCPTNSVYFSFAENVFLSNTVLTCDDLDEGSNSGQVNIDLWIWDNLSSSIANKSTCTVTINLQDNHNVCDNVGTGNQVATVSGNVQTEDLKMVDDVEISISSNIMESDMMSDEGEFAFQNLAMYNNYKVDAFKDDNYLNGVSTLDLVLIQRHILGLQKLETPYKIIAADVNNSESITVVDLIELRKLILGIYEELPNNNSWRFVESAFTFVDQYQPFPFQENVDITDLDESIDDANFIGVKIGDVNTSAVSSAQSSNIETRSNIDPLNIEVVNSTTDKGNQRLQFVATENMDILGSQMAMTFDASNSELLAMIPMKMNLSNENVAWDRVELGAFLMSWNTDEKIRINKGDVLFELLFKGKNADVKLNASLQNFSSEIYTLNEDVVITNLINFEGTTDNKFSFEVSQNVPNPFKDETVITFTLEEEGPVVLTVSDQTGRLLYKVHNEYNSGINSITLSSESINATGLLYYQLSTENQTVTKKMIVLQ